MADRKENLKSLFTNTRTRVIILFTAALMLFAIVVGLTKMRGDSDVNESSASISSAPTGIQSIPGAAQTEQYKELQEKQNLTQATVAQQTGTSAIPTLIGTQSLGEGSGVVGGKSGIGFTKLSQDNILAEQRAEWINKLEAGNCSKKDVEDVVADGATIADLKQACSCIQLKDLGYNAKDLNSVCQCKDLKAAGVTAREFKEQGYTVKQLRECGFDACALRGAGFTAQEMKDGGFSDGELKGAGFSDLEIAGAANLPAGISIDDIKNAGCDVEALKKLRKAGVSATAIKSISGCSADKLLAAGYTVDELKKAGYTAKELKDAGVSAEELRKAGFSAAELKEAGFSAAELRNAGFSAKELKEAGFSAKELKEAGFSAKDLKDAGFSLKELKEAGYDPKALIDAGFSTEDLINNGFTDAQLQQAGLVTRATLGQQQGGTPGQSSTNQLEQILAKQNEQIAEQKYQQKIQQRTSDMLSAGNQMVQEWKKTGTQTYVESADKDDGKAKSQSGLEAGQAGIQQGQVSSPAGPNNEMPAAMIKTGDIVFAVLDTAVSSDEPGPILATIVTGRLKGTKLIGSFNLPSNADKMVITFNTMSVPGAPKSTSISAYAIDPNTGRTALSSRTNHHYLMRYGSLFAASFLQGFGNAFQSANTTVTIGGTGGGNNVTVQNGIGRSTLQNAVIGLATVGKSWGQQAQQLFNTPTTVQVYAGTSMGILFTQDVTSL